MSEKKLGTCDLADHPTGTYRVHFEPHCERDTCLNWRCGEPVASPQATRTETIASLYAIVGKHHKGCEALPTTIIGGLGCTCNGVRHITHGDAQKCLAGDHSECESFPSEGTTPQAERLVAELKTARTVWHEDFGVPVSEKYANFLEAIGKLTDYVEARAVAPVETRLTAEQFPKSFFEREVGHDRAREAVNRFCNSHFSIRNGKKPQACIPANPDDDDIVLVDYIAQQRYADQQAAGLREEIDRLKDESTNWKAACTEMTKGYEAAEAEAAALREREREIKKELANRIHTEQDASERARLLGNSGEAVK